MHSLPRVDSREECPVFINDVPSSVVKLKAAPLAKANGVRFAMVRLFLIARRYLAPTPRSFWEWRDSGKVLTWKDGTTIGFLPEVERVLERLAPYGLPPMDAIAFFLAACRSGWRSSELELRDRRHASEIDIFRDYANLPDLAVALDRIAKVPHEFRDTPDRKAELAAVIFETGPHFKSSETATVIVDVLRRGLPSEFFLEQTQSLPHAATHRLESLVAGAARVDPARLKLRQQTGLDQLPDPHVEAPPDESFTGFLRRLERDEELGSMARLARNLMAALTLPRSMSEQQELPLGGVSDITNRGSLDRLLVSELAHDDLTFTVRVALNEALYLRREAPPNEPPRRRVMLLDSGLRMWGVPRVFATAAALALTGTRPGQDSVAVYRAHGAHLDHVELTTRNGLVSHLAALEEAVHPGASLTTLRRLVGELDDAGDVVLVTGEDVLADPGFRRELVALELPLLYIVTVNRAGRLTLSRRTAQGMSRLREAHCQLEKIMPPSPQVTPIINSAVDPSLPAILRLSQFPLLLSHNFDPRRVWGHLDTGGVLCLTHDRRLMHWTNKKRGGQQISDTMPRGGLHWHDGGTDLGGRTLAVVGQFSNDALHLLHVNLNEATVTPYQLPLVKHHPSAVAAHAGALLVIFRNHVELFSQSDGRFIASIDLPPGMKWQRGRLFEDWQGWYVLSFNGTGAELELVCKREQYQSLGLIGLFERLGVDGPLGVTGAGELRLLYQPAQAVSSDLKLRMKHLHFSAAAEPPKFSVLADTSPDGRWLVLKGLDSHARIVNWRVDWNLGQTQPYYGEALEALGSFAVCGLHNNTLRHRFTSVSSTGDALVLTAAKGRRQLTIGLAGKQIRLVDRKPYSELKGHFFSQSPAPAGVGYKLWVAQWNDGSRATLDSRGLLHLKSSDQSIPETTLVLSEPAVSGWCADGRFWGAEYFTGDALRTDPEIIYRDVLLKFACIAR